MRKENERNEWRRKGGREGDRGRWRCWRCWKTKETGELKRSCGGPLVEREILYNWKASLKWKRFSLYASTSYKSESPPRRAADRIDGNKRIYYGQVSLFGRVCARLTSHECGNDYSAGTVFRVIKISVFNLRYWTKRARNPSVTITPVIVTNSDT